jgi:uncharacterized protein (DUF488 family)
VRRSSLATNHAVWADAPQFMNKARPSQRTGFEVPTDTRAMAGRNHKPLVIYTVGHSTRDLPAFLQVLRSHGVKQIADVRTIPRSRRNPQYNAETLPRSLRPAGIRYVHLPALGGLRHTARDSVNTGWQNASFRGFADYMQTIEFERGLGRLIELASARPTAIMCAEAVPWRCHRSLIADALAVRDVRVLHIFGAGRAREHTLTPFAHVEGRQITYPDASAAT